MLMLNKSMISHLISSILYQILLKYYVQKKVVDIKPEVMKEGKMLKLSGLKPLKALIREEAGEVVTTPIEAMVTIIIAVAEALIIKEEMEAITEEEMDITIKEAEVVVEETTSMEVVVINKIIKVKARNGIRAPLHKFEEVEGSLTEEEESHRVLLQTLIRADIQGEMANPLFSNGSSKRISKKISSEKRKME